MEVIGRSQLLAFNAQKAIIKWAGTHAEYNKKQF